MDWMKFFFVVVSAGTVSTVTDWFFAGDWIQKRFSYPEIWRENHGGKGAALAGLSPFLTCAVFAFTANHLAIVSIRKTVELAAAVWVIGPLPLILTNAAYVKLHRLFTVSYLIGWLVKLTIIAVLVGRFLH